MTPNNTSSVNGKFLSSNALKIPVYGTAGAYDRYFHTFIF